MKRILVAGANGFLGRYICSQALNQGYGVIALSGQQPCAPIDPRLSHVCVRLENPGALYDDHLVRRCADVEVIINASGPGDPSLPRQSLCHLHAFRTSQLLSLALRLPNIKHFVQVSSIAIAGNHAGLFTESMRDVGQQFHGGIGAAYLAAERSVVGTVASFSRSIARFGVLVGDSQSGYYPRLSGVYHVLNAAHKLRRWRFLLDRLGVLTLPFSEQARCHLVPVDLAAEAAVRISCQPSQDNGVKTYHVVGSNRGISVRRLLAICLSDAGFDVELLPIGEGGFSKKIFDNLGLHSSLVEALTTRAFWSQEHFSMLMPDFQIPSLHNLSPVLLGYAHDHLLGAERK